jgi:hypothetical protein
MRTAFGSWVRKNGDQSFGKKDYVFCIADLLKMRQEMRPIYTLAFRVMVRQW